MKASDLLEGIALQWRACLSDYRRAVVELGRLLERFIVLRVEELGDLRRISTGMPVSVRRKRGQAVWEAARRLQVVPERVLELVSMAAVVDLTGVCNPERVTLDALKQLSRMVERGEDGAWRIKAQFDGRAEDLAKTALEERWSAERVAQAVGVKFCPSKVRSADRRVSDRGIGGRALSVSAVSGDVEPAPAACPEVPRSSADKPTEGARSHQRERQSRSSAAGRETPEDRATSFLRLAGRATSRDLVEMIVGMLERAQDPGEVLDLLQEKLPEVVSRIRRSRLVG